MTKLLNQIERLSCDNHKRTIMILSCPLPGKFEENYTCGHRCVQGIKLTVHGYGDKHITMFFHQGTETSFLIADDQAGRNAEICLINRKGCIH